MCTNRIVLKKFGLRNVKGPKEVESSRENMGSSRGRNAKREALGKRLYAISLNSIDLKSVAYIKIRVVVSEKFLHS